MPYNLAENLPEFYIPGVKRIWWGARPPLAKEPMRLPLSHVRLSQTGTANCCNRDTCSNILKVMQRFYMQKANLVDIPYNFLIGGDGFVYKGRGWFTEPARPHDLKHFTQQCLEIAYIGKYTDSKPSPKLEKLACDLIALGVATNKIKPDYKLINLGE